LAQLDHEAFERVVVFQLVYRAPTLVVAQSWSRLSGSGAAVIDNTGPGAASVVQLDHEAFGRELVFHLVNTEPVSVTAQS
jgi:hypothetical protein